MTSLLMLSINVEKSFLLKWRNFLFRLSKTVNLFVNFLALAKRKPTSKTN